MKSYKESDLRKKISKKYHSMIDWEATAKMNDDLYLIENEHTHEIGQSRYIINEPMSQWNWYLRKIKENPGFDW